MGLTEKLPHCIFEDTFLFERVIRIFTNYNIAKIILFHDRRWGQFIFKKMRTMYTRKGRPAD
jgi:hypothetical protein